MAAVIVLARKTRIDPLLLLDDWEERAAVREYLGQLERTDAEARAVDDVMALNLKQLEIV